LKIEARILLSKCSQDLCASAILRGRGFDALLIAVSCLELCRRLELEGYMEELRYSIGDCSCNLPPPRGLLGYSRRWHCFSKSSWKPPDVLSLLSLTEEN